ncbi:MAG: hypothetical protein RQ750_13165, partial [Roseovarius sp.]|nr:hypothetical protein [Roseovarius sp.]
MTSFRIIHARFPDPSFSRDKVENRLTSHRRALLAARKGWQHPLNEDGTLDNKSWQDLLDDIDLTWSDQKKIGRRAETISQRHKAATGIAHLRSDDAKKIEVLREGVRLAQVSSEHHADELAAALHAEFPWMAPATEIVWHAMRRSVRAGDPGVRIPPILLDGPLDLSRNCSAPLTWYFATKEKHHGTAT